MSLLLVVGLCAIAWTVLCALVLALCVSAKEGDGLLGGPADPCGPFGRRRRAAGGTTPTLPSLR